ncbi:TIGR02452 family protein [Goodfellowiella coeruleoviolacea]|nr:TIGR02452 family protein [Goodfellowiella coeruleoviolacea]
MNRQQRTATAEQTDRILRERQYTAPSGARVDLTPALSKAVRGTRLYLPEELSNLLRSTQPISNGATHIEVTAESTLQAGRRLIRDDTDPVACLNFASAKKPGGGYRTGAHAQEESLARCSGLVACLESVPEYYEFHRAQRDPLYSHRIIYSPSVPVFRDESGELLAEPYRLAFLTSPAPNASAIRLPEQRAELPRVLSERAAKVLAVAHAHGHRRLVLGAWGCGVFGNDPRQVARIFADLLLPGGQFAGRFAHVVFAVFDQAPGRPALTAFHRTFPSTG